MKTTRATDFTVILEDKPGTLAEFGAILGKEGINIEGLSAFIHDRRGVVHFIASDSDAAIRVLDAAKMPVADEREVLILDIEDRPGALGEIARKLADAGVNLELIYIATKTRLVIGADDIEMARVNL